MKIKTFKISKNFSSKYLASMPGVDKQQTNIWINLNRIRQKEINSIEFKFWLKKLKLSGKFWLGWDLFTSDRTSPRS